MRAEGAGAPPAPSSFLAAYLLLTARLGFDLLFEAEAHLLLLHSPSLLPWKQQHHRSTPFRDLLASGDQTGDVVTLPDAMTTQHRQVKEGLQAGGWGPPGGRGPPSASGQVVTLLTAHWPTGARRCCLVTC